MALAGFAVAGMVGIPGTTARPRAVRAAAEVVAGSGHQNWCCLHAPAIRKAAVVITVAVEAVAWAMADMAVSAEVVAPATDGVFSVSGGDGGFGGGGGVAYLPTRFLTHPGKGGPFGGHADKVRRIGHGGGGGALGGAIFNHDGTVSGAQQYLLQQFRNARRRRRRISRLMAPMRVARSSPWTIHPRSSNAPSAATRAPALEAASWSIQWAAAPRQSFSLCGTTLSPTMVLRSVIVTGSHAYRSRRQLDHE